MLWASGFVLFLFFFFFLLSESERSGCILPVIARVLSWLRLKNRNDSGGWFGCLCFSLVILWGWEGSEAYFSRLFFSSRAIAVLASVLSSESSSGSDYE